MGTIERGRSGCACPENILLREVLNHLMLRSQEHVVVDMEAGVEHLGRGTAEGVDTMLVVVEPGWASIQTAARVADLARDLGIRKVQAIANKISGEADLAFVRENLVGLPLLGVLRSTASWSRRRAPEVYPATAPFIKRCCESPRRPYEFRQPLC